MTLTIEQRLWKHMNTSLIDLCAQMGICKTRGRWSNRNYARYLAVSRELHRLKLAGVVKFVRGKGAGWRLV